MRIAVVVLNAIMFLFTVMVCIGDGMPTNLWYRAFTWLLLFAPLLTARTLWTLRVPGALPTRLRIAVAGLNALVVICIAAAFADQYPHPNEPGFLPYVVIVLFTPAASAWMLLARGRDTP